MLDGAKKVAIIKTVEVSWEPALDADFGGSAIDGFADAAEDFVARERISIRGTGTAAKSAKAAADKADVGEIDVAIDDVGDGVTDGFAAETVSRGDESVEGWTFSGGEAEGLIESRFGSPENSLESFANLPRTRIRKSGVSGEELVCHSCVSVSYTHLTLPTILRV